MYALLAAAHSIEYTIPIDQLVSGKWFSKEIGLTANDLVRIAQEFGLSALYRSKFTIAALRDAGCPAMLLLDDELQQGNSNHWVTYLGFRDSNVVIYDSHAGCVELSVSELMSRWSGVAVVVTDRRELLNGIWWLQLSLATIQYLPPLVFALGVSCCLVRGGGKQEEIPGVSRQIGLLLIFIGGWVSLDCVLSHGSLLADRHLLASLKCIGSDRTIIANVVEVDDLAGYTVVDARFPVAFENGHLPGALNIPVNSSHSEIAKKLDGIGPDQRVLVYCQSRDCHWADQLASRLICFGYKAEVLRDGIQGWVGRRSGVFWGAK